MRDQNELRERIAILKSLEEKYKGERYVPITMNELTDTLMIFEELLDLRQMSQDFGRNHDDYLEQLRGSEEEEIEDDDGLTGELFETSDDEEHHDHENHSEFEEHDHEYEEGEYEEEHDDENPWAIEEDEHHVEEEEHLEEAWDHEEEMETHHEHHEEDDDWEFGDSDEDHFQENAHDMFVEHEAEKIAEEHNNDDEVDGHDVIADSDALHNLMDKVQHHTEDLQSPNLSELSYDSVNIKKNQNHETLNDEILVIEGLQIIFDKIFMNVPDDKEYLNGITSEDHDQVEEIFGIVHDYMEEYNNEETHLHEELDFLIKTIALLPVSNDHILQFFDLFEKYSEIGGKLKVADYTCQQKNKVISKKLELFTDNIQTILKDLKNMSSVLISIENEGDKIGNRIHALTERSDEIDYIDKYDIAITFVPTLIDAKTLVAQKLSETREILMYMPHTKEYIEESIDDYDVCATG